MSGYTELEREVDARTSAAFTQPRSTSGLDSDFVNRRVKDAPLNALVVESL
jgi:hypothetical protein